MTCLDLQYLQYLLSLLLFLQLCEETISSGKTKILEQFETLNEVSPVHRLVSLVTADILAHLKKRNFFVFTFPRPFVSLRLSESEFRDGNEAANRAKNRYQDILPSDRHRPYLLTTKPEVANNYINAGEGAKMMVDVI